MEPHRSQQPIERLGCGRLPGARHVPLRKDQPDQHHQCEDRADDDHNLLDHGCTVTAAVSVNCSRVSAGSFRCSVPEAATAAPTPAPASAPIAAPEPPPAMPPTRAPRPAPPATFRVVFLPSPPPFCSICAVTMSYFRPPKLRVFAFSEILSAPLKLPACSTFATCSTTAALRGTTTFPPSITGSSSTALKVIPVLVASTSIACVRRTFSTVPDGTVIGDGARAGSGAAWGGVLRGENSTAMMSSSGNSAICPLASRTRTILTSALMKEPSTL